MGMRGQSEGEATSEPLAGTLQRLAEPFTAAALFSLVDGVI